MLCFFPQLLSDPTHPPNPCSLSLKQTKSKEEKKKPKSHKMKTKIYMQKTNETEQKPKQSNVRFEK